MTQTDLLYLANNASFGLECFIEDVPCEPTSEVAELFTLLIAHPTDNPAIVYGQYNRILENAGWVWGENYDYKLKTTPDLRAWASAPKLTKAKVAVFTKMVDAYRPFLTD